MVNGVGECQVQVNDLWMCSVAMRDGSRQSLEGWSVNKVTSTFPFIDMVKAEEQIKSDAPDDKELQALKSPSKVGGDVDILLGIAYTTIFPERVHMLETGLAIYELKMSPHTKGFNAVIGGPSEHFEYLVGHVGSMSLVFANLTTQLENYKNLGPPKLSRVMMTAEDYVYAKDHKEWGLGTFGDGLLDGIDLDEDLEEISLVTESSPVVSEPGSVDSKSSTVVSESLTTAEPVSVMSGSGDKFVDGDTENIAEGVGEGAKLKASCDTCGVDLPEDVFNCVHLFPKNNDEETLAQLRLQKAQNEGISIDYRCPRCRKCTDCRRSFETERVSLREETEDFMIYESVELDWERNQIVCTLPVRGSEEEFLTSNRDIALRVLDQQCKKYHGDDDTKAAIKKAFDKLIKNEQMVLFDDLTVDQKEKILAKPVNYWIPWRVVFKVSLSTPCRPVFDATSNTKPREDGTGGRSLNDLVVKGRVVTLNLIKMLMRFVIGAAAVQGDLKQFYASIKLLEEFWNLQRVLYRENLDPNAEVKEFVVRTLIWGVKCVSAQSECAVMKLADIVEEESPRLAAFLRHDRFVDDLAGSDLSIENIKILVAAANKWFSKVGLACKGWTYSSEDPPEDVAEDGNVVSVGGLKWHSKCDLIEVALPDLHFSKKARGRLVEGTQVFRGTTLNEMDKFVPQDLSRRQVFSKNGTVFDPLGKLVPFTAGLSVDLRDSVKATIKWDDCVGIEMRSKWVKNFLRIENMKGIKFQRAKLPHNAASYDMEVIVAADASEQVMVTGAWGRFLLDDNTYSCQHIIGRSLLAEINATIAKLELTCLMMGSNLGWIMQMALEGWISKLILIGDSTIALCWVTSENKKLSLFHRNRCVQIRRGTDPDQLYHVTTDNNPADLPTRPSLVQEKDVGSMSTWEKGMPWMRHPIDDAVANGILTPVSKLRLSDKEEEDFNKGFIYEKTKDILTKGHVTVLTAARVENVLLRAKFSNYLVPLNKFKLEKTVRVLAIVIRFLNKITKGKFFKKTVVKFQVFTVTSGDQKTPAIELDDSDSIIDHIRTTHLFIGISFGCRDSGLKFVGKYHVQLNDADISSCLFYLFAKATAELKQFQKKDFLDKISFDKQGILMCKSRVLEGQRLTEAGGLENMEIIKDLNLNFFTPVVDRYSPLAYSLADYVHRVPANHAGYESSYRVSLNHCYILQGLGLYREVGEDCTRCIKKRKQFLDLSMGPISDEQLVLAPAMWIAMCDVYGPVDVYAPGFSMKTRNRKEVQAKVYVLVFCCPVTKVVNMQVIEGKSVEAFAEGFTRLGCEIGLPSYVFADQESALMKLLKEAEVNILDLQYYLYKEVKGIQFKVCPVSGHNFHGLVERRIRTIQECLDECEMKTKRLHATGVQTFCKIVENNLNNLPLGYSYGRGNENSPLLKLICPNILRVGRLNTRVLQGPVRLPKGPSELMEKVEEKYEIFYKIWNISYIPRLIKTSKWYKTGDQLAVGDIVYFKKTEGALSSDWIVGKVVDVIKSKDDVVRKVEVQYQNASENIPRFTLRAARSLVKLFNIEDTETWTNDMEEIEKLMKTFDEDVNDDASDAMVVGQAAAPRKRLNATSGYDGLSRQKGVTDCSTAVDARDKVIKKWKCSNCCCKAHCGITGHNKADVTVSSLESLGTQPVVFSNVLDASWQTFNEYVEVMEESVMMSKQGKLELTSLLSSTDVDFDVNMEMCDN